MRAIQMVDLKSQYHKIKKEVDKAVLDVLESSAFINGKPVQDFATGLSVYLNTKHVIPCANGTDALQIALMALGLQPGDEVITASFTFIATAEVIALLHLKPVFVDVDRDTFCMDVASLRKAITPNTKAIVPVHLYGHVANMEEIMAIANEHDIPVVEDTAQAIGADFIFSDGTKKKAGTIGTFGATSFFPSKNLGCYGDGGALFTNDDTLAEKAKMIAAHGAAKRYYHDMVGINSRLDTIQAAVLNIKLPHLDSYIEERTRAANFYDNAFAGNKHIKTPYRAKYSKHVFHQYTIQLEEVDRDGLQQWLQSKGVPSMLYYPVPAHAQKMFSDYGTADADLPNTNWLTSRVLSLPMHTELDEEQLDFITSSVLEYLNQ
ncbi:MAG: transcriptional regulator [Pseudopedobacter saltans]|uniref:Transcriptional regulator n=1 Tax=Pseudopedobacter saltans TaxID=151895 RepID=A0A2W5GR69_9SPHI|nr:MAG: transcriptional regulator [Pseudopedobacter saltans]